MLIELILQHTLMILAIEGRLCVSDPGWRRI